MRGPFKLSYAEQPSPAPVLRCSGEVTSEEGRECLELWAQAPVLKSVAGPRVLGRGNALCALSERAAEVGQAASRDGVVSPKIPALAGVDPTRFGFAVTTVTGHRGGHRRESDVQFSLQCMTKLFALAALLRVEPTAWEHVGWAPTELGYNSVSEPDGRPVGQENPSSTREHSSSPTDSFTTPAQR